MLAMKEKRPVSSAVTKQSREVKESHDFLLDNELDNPQSFELEDTAPDSIASSQLQQNELFLPIENPEAPDDQAQLEIGGLEKPIFAMSVEGIQQTLQFHYASNLLESLEAQGVQVPYQCRDGYCGGCRTDLLEGEVAYLQEPMAWINKGEILPCCCVPKTPLKLKLKG